MSVLTKLPFDVQIKNFGVRREIVVASVQCRTSYNKMASADELRVTTICKFKILRQSLRLASQRIIVVLYVLSVSFVVKPPR